MLAVVFLPACAKKDPIPETSPHNLCTIEAVGKRSKVNLFYNGDDNMVRAEFFENNGVEFVLVEAYGMESWNGDQLEVARQTSGHGSSQTYTYQYNEQGLLQNRVMMDCNNKCFKDLFFYDDDGRLRYWGIHADGVLAFHWELDYVHDTILATRYDNEINGTRLTSSQRIVLDDKPNVFGGLKVMQIRHTGRGINYYDTPLQPFLPHNPIYINTSFEVINNVYQYNHLGFPVSLDQFRERILPDFPSSTVSEFGRQKYNFGTCPDID